MRPKDYGIEYRTLSNFWLASPRHVNLIHDLCGFVIGFMQKDDDTHQELWEKHCDEVRATINAGDRESAGKLWKEISIHLPEKLAAEVSAVGSLPQQDFYETWGIKIKAAEAA